MMSHDLLVQMAYYAQQSKEQTYCCRLIVKSAVTLYITFHYITLQCNTVKKKGDFSTEAI